MVDSADVYELAYEEAVRALTEQQTKLQSMRTNAGILLSAAAIATSFLGGAALRAGDFTKLSWIAVTLFAALAAAIFGILWPRKDWEFVAMHGGCDGWFGCSERQSSCWRPRLSFGSPTS